MIIAERKPLSELLGMLEGAKDITVLGCRSCTAICLAGGEKEAKELSEALSLHSELQGKGWRVATITVERACEKEFLSPLEGSVGTLISLACGVGAQVVQAMCPELHVLPGVNTTSMGAPEGMGVFLEQCAGCGDCILHLTAGICPIARCAKSLLNGPCGGSQDGRCEISPDTPCAWEQIVRSLEARGRLDLLEANIPPKDWRSSRSGGPRRTVNAEASAGEQQKAWREEG
ncbi:MAG: methylenetetrahydrofolate reductase C-terminal domain-containing protein [Methanomassiliicoccales archaeon]|nr:methylenetetrahydrofolate reductase C-terminal domain-containing protein [Methanomassiliicoccales archaeon]